MPTPRGRYGRKEGAVFSETEATDEGFTLQAGQVTNAVPALIFYVESQGHFRFANESVCGWFGRSRRDIVGHRLRDILGLARYEVVRRQAEAALAPARPKNSRRCSHLRGAARPIALFLRQGRDHRPDPGRRPRFGTARHPGDEHRARHLPDPRLLGPDDRRRSPSQMGHTIPNPKRMGDPDKYARLAA